MRYLKPTTGSLASAFPCASALPQQPLSWPSVQGANEEMMAMLHKIAAKRRWQEMAKHRICAFAACLASLTLIFAYLPCIPPCSFAEESEAIQGYSLRLLVGFDGEPQTGGDIVIGSYGTTVLLGYSSPFDMARAYEHYRANAQFVAVDSYVHAQGQDEDEGIAPQPIAPGQDALSELAAKNPETDDALNCHIAVIDTGYTGVREIEKTASVLGEDGSDDNGHGTDMVRTIQNENPEASIMSVKALDASGRGTVSSVYAGIEYAIGAQADILNLSFSMRTDPGCPALEAAVQDAQNAGALVIAAAGNEGEDASLFSPGAIQGVIAAGACDSAGNISGNSNYGNTVDVWCIAQSTSRSAARVTGWLSRDDNALDWRTSLFAEGSVAYGCRTADEELWTVRFDVGEADGGIPEQTVAISPYSISPDSTDISVEGLELPGHTFAGWSLTASDGSQLIVPPSQTKLYDLQFDAFDGESVISYDLRDYAQDGIITLHALWKKEEEATAPNTPLSPHDEIPYTLRFSPNGGTGHMDSMTFTWREGEFRECELPSCPFMRKGYEFAGWATIKPSSSSIDPVIVPDRQALVNLSYVPDYGDDVPDSSKLRIGLMSYEVDGIIELSAVWRDTVTGELLGAPVIEEKPIIAADSNIYQHVYSDGNYRYLSTSSARPGGFSAGPILYIAPSSGNSVYRLMNPNMTCSYLFTCSTSEVNDTVAAGWKNQGVVFYSKSSNPRTVIYRFNRNGAHGYGVSSSWSGWSLETEQLFGQAWTVSFNANGGSGAPGNQYKYYGSNLTLSSTKPTRAGYTFNGWNTNSSGSGTNYSAGSSYTSNSSTTLYAKWAGNTYYVFYKQGTATGGWSTSTYATQSRTFPNATTLRTNSMTKSETNDATYTVTYDYNGSGQTSSTATAYKKRSYTADGWTTTSGSTTKNYANGASFGSSSTTSLTLYPCFSQSTYDSSITAPSPTRAGYTFTGWYTAANGGSKVADAGGSWTPGSTRTVYAHWQPDLAFSIPTEINYVVSADGTLSPRNAEIVNEGAKDIEISGVSASPENEFTFVENLDHEASSASIELTFSANGETHNLAQMSSGAESLDASKWRVPVGGKLSVASSGRLNRMNAVVNRQRIGTITWTLRTTS